MAFRRSWWTLTHVNGAFVEQQPVCPMCLELLARPERFREAVDVVGDPTVPVGVYCAKCDWTGRVSFLRRAE